jgi:aminoglycoside phosphotransferase
MTNTQNAVLPAPVSVIAAGRSARLVWDNAVGGRTFEIGDGPDRCFVKWSPVTSGIDLAVEATRMTWAAQFTPVPRLLASSSDEEATWLVTAPLPGCSAVHDKWIAEPRTAVRAIGEGLRAMHDSMPAADCPFSWMAAERLDWAVSAAAEGRLDPAAGWDPVDSYRSVSDALDELASIPPVDKLVVCHGDACAPNTLLTDDGRWSGHVDLGELGLGDRWADLAIATWSAGWNYGPGWEGDLLAAYGVEPDPERTRYYRMLWDFAI